MIDYDYENSMMIMDCDVCGQQDSTFFGDFRECIREAKEEGWKIKKIGEDDWHHTCPFCVAEETDPRKVF